jgi:hypothetical protein
LTKKPASFVATANDIIEKDQDELNTYNEQRPYWITAYNTPSGASIASLKTALMHRQEAV